MQPERKRGNDVEILRLVGALILAAATAVALWYVLPGGELEALGRVAPPPAAATLRIPAGTGPDSVARLIDRGMTAYGEGDYDAAAALLARAITARSGPEAPSDADAGAHFFLGIARLMSGSRAEARESLEAALEPAGNPYAAEARFYLAKTWLLMGRADSALAHLHAVPSSVAPTRVRAEALADSVRRTVR